MAVRAIVVLCLGVLVMAGPAESAPSDSAGHITGVGGIFFKAKDPKALAAWYETNLGVSQFSGSADSRPWRTEAGTTVFSPFKEDTKYFGDPRLQWMINFRVRDLDKMIAQLRKAGIAVAMEGEDSAGRFARLSDPEGNPIQLWQPRNQG